MSVCAFLGLTVQVGVSVIVRPAIFAGCGNLSTIPNPLPKSEIQWYFYSVARPSAVLKDHWGGKTIRLRGVR